MNDRELLKTARKNFVKGWELGSDCSIRNLFDRFEQMLDGKEPEPKSIVWEPKVDETYYYNTPSDYVGSVRWTGNDNDLYRLKNHNVYQTRKLAEKAAPHQTRHNMVLQAVMNLEPDQVVDWSDNNQTKFQVSFDHKAGCWYDLTWYSVEKGYPPLTDKKNVQPLLDYLNAKEKENG